MALMTFVLHENAKIELEIICILEDKTMSAFIRAAIQEKIARVKESHRKKGTKENAIANL